MVFLFLTVPNFGGYYNGNKYWLQFSKDRINTSKRLIKTNSDSIDFIVKQIAKQIEQMNLKLQVAQNVLISIEGLLNSVFFKYLNRYSNGLIRFTKPSFLNEILTKDTFGNLFKLFVDIEVQKNIINKENPNELF